MDVHPELEILDSDPFDHSPPFREAIGRREGPLDEFEFQKCKNPLNL
jgi:hypothetical protein